MIHGVDGASDQIVETWNLHCIRANLFRKFESALGNYEAKFERDYSPQFEQHPSDGT
jgi:hypothetical protein